MSGGILLADAWLSALPLWLYLPLGVTGGALLYFAALSALREPLVVELVQKLRRRSTPAQNR